MEAGGYPFSYRISSIVFCSNCDEYSVIDFYTDRLSSTEYLVKVEMRCIKSQGVDIHFKLRCI